MEKNPQKSAVTPSKIPKKSEDVRIDIPPPKSTEKPQKEPKMEKKAAEKPPKSANSEEKPPKKTAKDCKKAAKPSKKLGKIDEKQAAQDAKWPKKPELVRDFNAKLKPNRMDTWNLFALLPIHRHLEFGKFLFIIIGVMSFIMAVLCQELVRDSEMDFGLNMMLTVGLLVFINIWCICRYFLLKPNRELNFKIMFGISIFTTISIGIGLPVTCFLFDHFSLTLCLNILMATVTSIYVTLVFWKTIFKRNNNDTVPTVMKIYLAELRKEDEVKKNPMTFWKNKLPQPKKSMKNQKDQKMGKGSAVSVQKVQEKISTPNSKISNVLTINTGEKLKEASKTTTIPAEDVKKSIISKEEPPKSQNPPKIREISTKSNIQMDSNTWDKSIVQPKQSKPEETGKKSNIANISLTSAVKPVTKSPKSKEKTEKTKTLEENKSKQ